MNDIHNAALRELQAYARTIANDIVVGAKPELEERYHHGNPLPETIVVLPGSTLKDILDRSRGDMGLAEQLAEMIISGASARLAAHLECKSVDIEREDADRELRPDELKLRVCAIF